MTPPEPLPPLLPAQYRSPGERLLHGKGIAAAAGAGRAEDWARLDQGVATYTWRPGPRWSRGRVRVGFHWFDDRELADWTTAPHWHETGPDGGPGGVAAWSLPPTESEIALALCHADPRLRAAALRLAELPAAALPLVLLRCADTDGTVRELARALLSGALAGTGAAADEAVRALVPLALLLDLRRPSSGPYAIAPRPCASSSPRRTGTYGRRRWTCSGPGTDSTGGRPCPSWRTPPRV
ncbi:hypothetical protein [Streptomyces zaomyceticus]|uniref:hypothetical protein n=1 Tax=Streptomyces zaomyceticus TaxID=68286 RepID=UPI0036B14777